MNQKAISHFKYTSIAQVFSQQIKTEVLLLGDKLPSVREVSREYGVSMSTVLQAYYDLEAKSLIEAKPKSGYYVSYSPKKFPAIPSISKPGKASREDPDEIIKLFFNSINNKNVFMFSLGVPANELLPIAKLNKGLVNSSRALPGSGTEYEMVQGNEKLRRQIAKRAFTWGGNLTEKDIIITSGCINALTLCLMALTSPGDAIAVESPLYFGILQLARGLRLKVIELPTHAATSIDLERLEKALSKQEIAACLLMPNFNNPLGSCMPDDNKKEVVALLNTYDVPLIEDDIYGDIYFGEKRPKPCKAFDKKGSVLWCGSFSKTVAPGYRVGWVAPGKYYDEILRLKMATSISSATITQSVIADFMENGRYENHLRKMRKVLEANCLQCIRAITTYFPEGTKVSRPQGGFFIWIELDKTINTVELFQDALKQKISIAPGKLFTLGNQYDNCLRLSYGWLWNAKTESALKALGKLIKSF